MRYMLADGHGNFGSVDGDPAAAMRYTEVRMSRISELMLQDIDKETVDFVPNYDESLKEPSVLPAKFPQLLVNGTSGIAVGMATNIPPHNMGEVIDGTLMLIDHPDATVEELMTVIKGPDFPTAGLILGTDGISRAASVAIWRKKPSADISDERFMRTRTSGSSSPSCSACTRTAARAATSSLPMPGRPTSAMFLRSPSFRATCATSALRSSQRFFCFAMSFASVFLHDPAVDEAGADAVAPVLEVEDAAPP